jgi:hypothetical protein
MSENLIMDDFFDDLNKPLTFKDRVAMGWWSFKYGFKSIFLIPRKIKWAHQRVTRGFSDRDMWSADYFLARQIAGMLNWIVNEGHGVSTSYGTPPNYEDDIEDMVARRDVEYLKYAAVFAEYAENGPALNEDWKNKLGGVLDNDLKEALQWFSEHFTEFWD